MRRLGGIMTAIAVAGLVVAFAATPSDAAKRVVRSRAFDGLWSVSIYTQNGPCSPSYRYPARIVNGQVGQAENDFSYQIAGTVVSSGAIAVTVSSGGQSATGYGRMTPTRGTGWWRTDGGQCSGVWNAIRRG